MTPDFCCRECADCLSVVIRKPSSRNQKKTNRLSSGRLAAGGRGLFWEPRRVQDEPR